MYQDSSVDLRLLREITALNLGDPQALVRCLRGKEHVLGLMPPAQQLPYWVAYLKALERLKDYERIPAVAQALLAFSVAENIQYHEEEDVFLLALYLKAKALLHIGRLQAAEHTLVELLKLNPLDKQAVAALQQCFKKSRAAAFRRLAGMGILLCLSSLFLTVLQILFLRPYLGVSETEFTQILVTVICLSALALITGYFYLLRQTKREAWRKARLLQAIRQQHLSGQQAD